MELKTLSTDALEQQMVANQRAQSRLGAENLAILEELDSRQVATADGCRSLSEWVAARLDVGPETAKGLVRTMRRTHHRPDLRRYLGSGEATFDRVEALSRIGPDVGLLVCLDVAGVRREAARRARLTTDEERRLSEDQFLVMQPSLDESWWRLWGGLDGYTGALVDKTLTEAADRLPDLPGGARGSLAWRRAMALGQVCAGDEAVAGNVSIFVDAGEASGSGGETGVVLEAGPRVGRQALEAILCDAEVEVVARGSDGRYLDYGRKARTVPPTLKRALLDRHGGRCAVDGCESRYRLEAHHLVPWWKGGQTDQSGLVILCWFHHQVVVHRLGFEVFEHPDHGRIRFRRPASDPEWEPPT